jgi:hypothetical protein
VGLVRRDLDIEWGKWLCGDLLLSHKCSESFHDDFTEAERSGIDKV